MADDPYTHNYEFSIGTNGEQEIEGECEFDTDGLLTYKISNSSDPLPKVTLEYFTRLMDLLHEIYVTTGGIELIRIKKKS
jgi:hypothetical protein